MKEPLSLKAFGLKIPGQVMVKIKMIKDKIKGLGSGVIGIAILFGLIFLAVIFTKGITWFGGFISPLMPPIFFTTVLVSIFVLIPMGLLKRTRGYAAIGFLISSYIYGVILWFSSLLITYDYWGGVGVAIGLFLMGIGIVPISLLATLFHADWDGLGTTVLLIILVYGVRLLAVWLGNKVDAEAVNVVDME